MVFRTEREKFERGRSRRSRSSTSRAGRSWSARSRSRSPRSSRRLLKKAGDQARGAERQVPRARGRDRGPGRPLGAVTIATNMAGRGTDIILGGVPDHRVEGRRSRSSRPSSRRPRARGAAQAAVDQVQAEMAGEFRRELQQRKLHAEERAGLSARRYLGLMASFSPDHPSVVAVRALAPAGGAARRATWTAPATCRAPTKEKIAKAFYPRDREPGRLPRRAPAEGGARGGGRQRRVRAGARRCSTPNERERVVALGGLHILGTERHEARRIDNQLRGRAGRQGDPGSSRFYLSLEDDLMRIFGSERISGLMLRLGMEEGVPIEHGMVTRSIERAQKQVEAQNFARPQAPARVRRRDEQAAQGRLRPAPHGARGQGHPRARAAARRRGRRVVRRQLLRGEGQPVRLEPGGPAGRAQGDLRPRGDARRPRPARPRTSWGRSSATSSRSATTQREQAIGAERMLLPPAHDHAADRRHAVEGPPVLARPPEGGHRPARLRPARPARRVQERVVQDVPGPDGPDRRGDPALELPVPAGAKPADREPSRAGRRRPWRELRAPVPASAPAEPELALAGVKTRAAQPVLQRPIRDAVGLRARPSRARPKGGTDEVQTVRREGPKVGRNDPCPCGSGKKYKKCHG